MADQNNSISIVVTDSINPQVAPRLIQIADGADRANASVGSLKSQLAGLQSSGGSLSSQLSSVQGSLSQTAKATQGVVSANVSAAASMGILEGRTLSMNRAAANFATRVLGLGSLLQAAFPIIGAAAMLSVFYQMGSSLAKVIKEATNAGREISKAFLEGATGMRRSNDELALTNDKLQQHIAILEHKPTTNGAAMALDEARVMADRLDESLDNVGKKLNEVLGKNQISEWGGLITGQKSTSEASDRIRKEWDTLTLAAEAKAQQDLTNTGALAYKTPALRESAMADSQMRGMQTRLDAIKQFKAEMTKEAGPVDLHGKPDTYHLNSDLVMKARAGEIAEYTGATKLADQAMNGLNLTISNMKFNKLQDSLHDSTSALKEESRVAKAEWTSMQAAYKTFQDTTAKSGHAASPQQSIEEINRLKNMPQYRQVLPEHVTSLLEPQDKKLADNNDWMKDQHDKLQNQISDLGMYGNALKQATMEHSIEQEAQKKGISLIELANTGYKAQIKEIVANADYHKELESVYESVNSVQDQYHAKTRALTTALHEGVLTQNQYSEAIKRTVRDYKEATDTATAFQRKLDEQKRDAGNKLGSNQDIAVKAELQSLAEQMRKGDATHPGGYSEQDIAKQMNAMQGEVRAQQVKNATDQEANKLIFAQINLNDELIIKQEALTAAVTAGAISQQAANAANLQAWIQQNDQQLKSGTGGNAIGGALADYAKNFAGVANGIKDSFSGVFKTLGDGFADTIGRALTNAKDLGKALKDVARSAIGELISSLIKLAIEALIVDKLMKAFKIKPLVIPSGPTIGQATEGVAGMTMITAAGLIMTKLLDGPMWSLAGAMAAVTFGASAAAGAAGIQTVRDQSLDGMSIAQNADGGYITGSGTSRSDSILSWLSNGEYVVNASAASQNRDVLDAINDGASHDRLSAHFATQVNASSNGTQRPQMRVEVHNNGMGYVETQQVSDDHIRLIVHAEAPQLIAQHAPAIIASDIGNPNSKTSKALTRSTFSTRRR